MFSAQMKKGSVELLVLSILDDESCHGYEIGKRIEERSGGRLQFRISSLYPILRRLEQRGSLRGRWVEKPGERRRRYYELTAAGQRELAAQRDTWSEFTGAINSVVEWGHV